METKKEIRKRILKQRRECPPEIRHEASGRIVHSVLQHPWFAEASDIYAYADFDGEAETRTLIETALREGKRVWLPKVRGEDMEFYPVMSMDSLSEGAFGILEPSAKDVSASENAAGKSLMLLPGVAFDRAGNRIGYGRGYYDRYLAVCPGIPKIALAFEFQITDRIPAEHTDIKADLIITEKGVLQL